MRLQVAADLAGSKHTGDTRKRSKAGPSDGSPTAFGGWRRGRLRKWRISGPGPSMRSRPASAKPRVPRRRLLGDGGLSESWHCDRAAVGQKARPPGGCFGDQGRLQEGSSTANTDTATAGATDPVRVAASPTPRLRRGSAEFPFALIGEERCRADLTPVSCPPQARGGPGPGRSSLGDTSSRTAARVKPDRDDPFGQRDRATRPHEDERAIVRTAAAGRSRLGDCASPNTTLASCGRLLLPALVLAAEQGLSQRSAASLPSAQGRCAARPRRGTALKRNQVSSPYLDLTASTEASSECDQSCIAW